jgi:hypothetical protein
MFRSSSSLCSKRKRSSLYSEREREKEREKERKKDIRKEGQSSDYGKRSLWGFD